MELKSGLKFKIQGLKFRIKQFRLIFALMNYITDVFLDTATIKKFQNMFSTSLNCLHNLCTFVPAAGILHPRPCVLFPFVSWQPHYLCQLDGRNLVEILYFLCNSFFRSNHRRCFVKKVFLKLLQISLENTCVQVPFKQIVVFLIKSLTSDFFLKKTPTQLLFCEICKILKNTYSFKLDLVGLTVFPDLNLRLAKIKLFTTVCISKFSRFCRYASSFGVEKLHQTLLSHSFSMH